MQARVLVLLLACALAVVFAQPALHGADRQSAAQGQPAATSSSNASSPTSVATPASTVEADGETDGEAERAVVSRADSGATVPDEPIAPTRNVDCRKRRCVALTFDDGPGLPTPRLLDTLARTRTKATFFLVGEMVHWHPKTARRIARDGHEIGVHSWNHADLRTLKPKSLEWQLVRTRNLITRTTGVTPTLARPPYGATNRHVLKAQGRAGLAEVLWNLDTSDWAIRNPNHVRSSVLKHVRRNSVVLMHDIRPTTVDAVPAMVKELKRRGFTLVTVTELLGQTRPGSSYFEWR